jgi:uncharacterized protein with ATP-grasp and redox domains
MSTLELPAPQIDPGTLPPPILTSEPGSFAQDTFRRRIPQIVRDVIDLNAFPADIRAALGDLHDEAVGGTVRPLREAAPDASFWALVSREHLGRSWLDVPWYWAEAFFYRRLLEATRYFQPGPWEAYDPFATKKQADLEAEATLRRIVEVLDQHHGGEPERFLAMLHASLWANRMDLSYPVVAQFGRTVPASRGGDGLLVDESDRVWRHLSARRCRRLAILADNAGSEIAADLALADLLLQGDLVGEVAVHLKPHPYFVSDAMVSDAHAAVEALAKRDDAGQPLAERIRACMRDGRIRLCTHWFYTTSLFYFQLPGDLRRELAATDLVVLKGDLNYRRLLGDAHWPPTTPFHEAAAYFPAPFVALRTLKAELIVGLPSGEFERLQASAPGWLVDGRRGVVQARLGSGAHRVFA